VVLYELSGFEGCPRNLLYQAGELEGRCSWPAGRDFQWRKCCRRRNLFWQAFQ